jgi:hypothetical protein
MIIIKVVHRLKARLNEFLEPQAQSMEPEEPVAKFPLNTYLFNIYSLFYVKNHFWAF